MKILLRLLVFIIFRIGLYGGFRTMCYQQVTDVMPNKHEKIVLIGKRHIINCNSVIYERKIRKIYGKIRGDLH